MSQSDLGNLIGLNSNRVQQYENGARKPKLDLAKKIAAALEVETSAILDPQVSSYVGAMYAFFEMEELYGLRLEEEDNQIHIVFGDKYNRNIINEHLEAWYNRKQILEKELAAAREKLQKGATELASKFKKGGTNTWLAAGIGAVIGAAALYGIASSKNKEA